MTVGDTLSRGHLVFVQIDMFQDVDIMLVLVRWKMCRHNDNLEAIGHLGLYFQTEWFRQIAVLGLGTQRVQRCVQELSVNLEGA